MRKKIKLHELPQRTELGIRIDITDDLTVRFHHLDGMYSYCTVDGGKSDGQPFHLAAWTPLIRENGHYALAA